MYVVYVPNLYTLLYAQGVKCLSILTPFAVPFNLRMQ